MSSYNTIKETSIEERKSSRIFQLRQAINFTTEKLLKAWIPSSSYNLNVLDVGCGSGGALWKLWKLGMTYYLGIEPSKQRLQEAEKRITDQMKETSDFYFINTSFLQPETWLRSFVSQDTFLSEKKEANGKYDLVYMGFCLHYFMKNISTTYKWLSAIRQCLRPGGRWIAITINWDVLRPHLENGKSFKNSICDIYPVKKDDSSPWFSYHMKLGDRLPEDQVEHAVHHQYLADFALKSFDLKLIHRESFTSSLLPASAWRLLSDDEKTIYQFYQVLVFENVFGQAPPPHIHRKRNNLLQ